MNLHVYFWKDTFKREYLIFVEKSKPTQENNTFCYLIKCKFESKQNYQIVNAVSGSWIENKLYQNDLYILCNKRQPFNLPLIILWLVGESNICKQNRLHVLHIIIISNNFITFWIWNKNTGIGC